MITIQIIREDEDEKSSDKNEEMKQDHFWDGVEKNLENITRDKTGPILDLLVQGKKI